jgi:ABC-type transport system involved in multi-copper enzyme maturation permease subunit
MSGVVIGETLRRHLTSVAVVSYIVLLAIVGIGMSYSSEPTGGWTSLVSLLAIILGCGPIGPEFSSGTLQLILVKPIQRSTYLLSRVTGVVLLVWLAAGVACTAGIVTRLLNGRTVGWEQFGNALLGSAAETLLTVSLLTLLGSLTRAYFNVALYIGVQVGLSILTAILNLSRRFPEVISAIQVVVSKLFPDAPRSFDRQWLLMVASNAAVALVLACLVFRRREVPYGAD